MEKVTLDITSVCRICFELKTDTRSLFTKENESSIHEKLVNHTNLDLHIDDGGPVTICEQCYEEFNVFVVFLDKCKRSNALFQQFKQNVKDSCDFDSSANYSIHADELNTKNTSKCNKDNLTPSVDTVPLKSAQSTSATHKCQLCCKVFTRKFNYKLHLKRHSGEREWQCARCGAATLTRVLALRHCSPGARRLCPAAGCGSSFTSATNLNIHIRRHNGERPYSCAECGKSFGSKNILSDHIRVHTGVKPYLCATCGRRFATNKLAAHARTHAPRAHACAACPRRFADARAARLHARTHAPPARPHACAACPARYCHKQSLNKHLRKRHGLVRTLT
ncbi:zinc finger protein 846 isoform X2 [Bicyclus anynana]|nr:zinc finger protein 846 isoform X2 [Bicyclus anynana]